jgi:hypothetical protein
MYADQLGLDVLKLINASKVTVKDAFLAIEKKTKATREAKNKKQRKAIDPLFKDEKLGDLVYPYSKKREDCLTNTIAEVERLKIRL